MCYHETDVHIAPYCMPKDSGAKCKLTLQSAGACVNTLSSEYFWCWHECCAHEPVLFGSLSCHPVPVGLGLIDTLDFLGARACPSVLLAAGLIMVNAQLTSGIPPQRAHTMRMGDC